MDYFNEDMKLWDITEKYPETIPVFTSNGFSNMNDAKQRAKFAKTISLGMSLMWRSCVKLSVMRFLL